jgi:aryl-alcohol dehydrogenase-like predicted oxidoreductase
MWSERLILGTSKLGVDGREPAFELLDVYVRLGGRTIDTASVYSDWIPGERGRAETVIGEWLKARGNRDALTIVTKGAHPGGGVSRCDEASIRYDVELSLTRLGIEQIDLWYLHRDEPARPAAEIVGVLQALVGEGKIAQFGCSNWRLPRIEEALAVPGQSFVSNQVLGNVFCRIMNPLADPTSVVVDAPMFRHAIEHGLSLFLYTTTAHGFFERRGKGIAPVREYDNAAVAEAAGKLEAIAAERGIDPAPMILAAMLQLAYPVRAVVGPRHAEQLRAMWRGGETVLPPGIVRRIMATTGMSEFFG